MIALLDTNAYTALVRGNERVLDSLSQATRLLMSSIVVGELEYGFRHGNQYQANRAQLDEFLAESYVAFLTVTRDTTTQYGVINMQLRRAGKQIPTNDTWIAAHAQEHGTALWTRDKHFLHVAGLSVHAW